MAVNFKTSTRIIRRKQVEALTGLSRNAIYDRITENGPYHDPTFPKPVKLGGRAIGFIESEVIEWIDSRIAERDKALDKKTA